MNLLSYVFMLWVLLCLSQCVSSEQGDYYELLGITRAASPGEIKKAFRRLALQNHPDKVKDQTPADAKRFEEATHAYEVLKDPQLRSNYDRFGHEDPQKAYQEHTRVFDHTGIQKLEHADMSEIVLQQPYFLVNFFSPGCRPCQLFAPRYIKIAEHLNGAIPVGVVNCDTHRYVCNQQGIRSYPTLAMYVKGRPTHYSGDRMDHTAVMGWIHSFVAHGLTVRSPAEYPSWAEATDPSRPLLLGHAPLMRPYVDDMKAELSLLAAQLSGIADVAMLLYREDIPSEIVPARPGLQHVPRPTPEIHGPPRADGLGSRGTGMQGAAEQVEKLIDDNDDVAINATNIDWTRMNIQVASGQGKMRWVTLDQGRQSALSTLLALHGIISEEEATNAQGGERGTEEGKWGHDLVQSLLLKEHEFQHTLFRNEKSVVAIFFVDNCFGCRRLFQLLPFTKLALPSDVELRLVNCSALGESCRRINVHRFPSAFVYATTKRGYHRHREVDIYRGDITPSALAAFVTDVTSLGLHDLSHANFNHRIFHSDQPWFVVFHSPACAPCRAFKTVLRQTAPELTLHANIGLLNCQRDGMLCRQLNIRSYPTMVLYRGPPQKRDIKQFTGSRTALAVMEFVTNLVPSAAQVKG